MFIKSTDKFRYCFAEQINIESEFKEVEIRLLK